MHKFFLCLLMISVSFLPVFADVTDDVCKNSNVKQAVEDLGMSLQKVFQETGKLWKEVGREIKPGWEKLKQNYKKKYKDATKEELMKFRDQLQEAIEELDFNYNYYNKEDNESRKKMRKELEDMKQEISNRIGET